ncbi:glycosyltransferase family 2 protein [Arcobacter sp. CECT 8985]|uniref:glycosyltransferase family 2 protein n=1 Tax=Arcobacter sp. CECT 8985 TaxID=1935424 RepID=UPI00100B55E8|nr:glycosyltransferase family 2 protein [Arcobacter sp. CECT 8985]RXJ84819.1 glycosyl transferase [Arcobacter sp. CECT 8985]
MVVIPTYNNPKTIKKVLDDVLTHNFQVIIVDDGSDTKVEDLIENKNITVLRHEKNRGKGQAILTGAKKAKELGYDFFISMDGDGQHLASEIFKLVDAKNSQNQIVIGSRNFNIENVPTISKVGRAFHNFWIKLNSGYDIKDSLTGFRLYPTSILNLNIKCKRFNFEAEVLVKHYWKYKNITDTTIECYYPTPEERVSHFDNYKDTISITLLHLKLFTQKIFLLKGLF